MSTAAPLQSRPAGSEQQIFRPLGQCSRCARRFEAQQQFIAVLLEKPAGFQRADCCLECWRQHDRTDVLAFWQTVMPQPQQRKKLFVDDALLCDLFERLADVTEPAKVDFRFVLGLILMRKRLLIHEATQQEATRNVWIVRLKGREQALKLTDPGLDEDRIRQVSAELAQILEQEL